MSNLRRFAAVALPLLLATLLPAAAFAEGLAPAAPPSPAFGPIEPFSSAPQWVPAEHAPPPPGANQPSEPPPRKRWYGWQILAPTLASDAMVLGGVLGPFMGGGISTRTQNVGIGLVVAGSIGHGLSGPIVHLAHRHPARALGSLALEAVLPGLFLLIGFGGGHCGGDDGVCPGALIGFFVGLPLAVTAGSSIDAAALAWDDAPPPKAPRLGAWNPSFNVAPLALPPLRVGSRMAPPPAGLAMVGTF